MCGIDLLYVEKYIQTKTIYTSPFFVLSPFEAEVVLGQTSESFSSVEPLRIKDGFCCSSCWMICCLFSSLIARFKGGGEPGGEIPSTTRSGSSLSSAEGKNKEGNNNN